MKISTDGCLKDGLLTVYVVSTAMNEFYNCGSGGCFQIAFSE
jgi:hypothetical protein